MLALVDFPPLIPFVAGKWLSRPLSPTFTAALAQAQQWFLLSVLFGLAMFWMLRSKNMVPREPSRWLRVLPPLAAFMLSAWVQWGFFDNIPHITDATSHVFQAKILASGRLTAENPPCPDAFFQHNVVIGRSGLWHTKYFPGQALWLTPGVALGAAWLMMPLGWGLATWAFGSLARRFCGESTGWLAAMLFATSPLGLLASASFMSHSTFLMFALVGFASWTKALDAREKGRGSTVLLLGSGISLGFAAITRPQDVLPAAVAVLATFLQAATATRGRMLRSLPMLLMGTLLPLLVLLVWNKTLYGGWLSSGYHFGQSPSLTPIIQDSFGFSATHTPGRAAWFTGLTLYRFDSALTGWPTVLPFMLLGLVDPKKWRIAIISLAVIVTTVGMYFFFPYLGFELEARYWTPALPAAILLVAQGLYVVAAPGNPVRDARRRALLAGLGFYTVMYYWPHYISPKYGHNYEQVSAELHDSVEAYAKKFPGERLLVLIESDVLNDFNYSSGFIYNDPDLTNEVIYARYRADILDCLRISFPERRLVNRGLDGSVRKL